MEFFNETKTFIKDAMKYPDSFIPGQKAIVLSSGGLDSLVVLKWAIEIFGKENTYSLDMFYNQNHSIEMTCSKNIAEHFGVKRLEIDISDIFKYSDSAMLKGHSDRIEKKSYAEQIYGEGGTGERHSVSTYCPNRNAVLIQAAGAVAISVGASYVCIGAHADDAAGAAYKDCTKSFFEAQDRALREGTDPEVRLLDPIIDFTKIQNVELGLALGLTEEEFAMSFSCYDPVPVYEYDNVVYKPRLIGYRQCGSCGTCIDRIEALKSNNLNPFLDKIYS